MLLQGQGVAVERPLRGPGALTGAIAGAVCLALAIALAIKISDWPISWQLFLGGAVAVALALAALLFLFWAYCCATLDYRLDSSTLTIRWGPVRHVIPLTRVTALFDGRLDDEFKVRGLNWWRHHVGSGEVEGIGPVIFYSTHSSPTDLVYVQTPNATYGISPQVPARFATLLRRFQQNAADDVQSETVERNWLLHNIFWSDRLAMGLTAGAILACGLVFVIVFAAYPDLDNRITIEFPPIGTITTLESKHELLKLPIIAAVLLGINFIIAFAARSYERGASYLLLAGALFLQTLLAAAAVIALVNA
ncbi:MAG TPA: PH domain-containing protein [Dehalococcoidia bacterium]|nr:PH domain-containing protein [Dehalococcoidia bacterium]